MHKGKENQGRTMFSLILSDSLTAIFNHLIFFHSLNQAVLPLYCAIQQNKPEGENAREQECAVPNKTTQQQWPGLKPDLLIGNPTS